MNRVIVASAFGAVVALSGCVTAEPVPMRQAFPTTEPRYAPELNTISKAELGDSIVSKEYVSRVRAITVEGGADDPNPPGTTSVFPGDLELIASRPEGEYYAGTNTYYVMLGQRVPMGERGGVFVPSDKSKPAVIYHFANGYRYGTKPIAYTPKEIVRFTAESFRRELVYSGVSQNTLTLMYREFKDNFARPAFTQELKYDLSQSRVIGYKGARFEVVDAGNTAITYKVLSVLQ
ncbi:hypothetical protein ACEN88_12495 [Massilia sp. CT11-108]|uniref:hypothetical protein n=1 Tax=Massilia sp. CT11-108 TaxID=3393900 RepID=UPI0039A43031